VHYHDVSSLQICRGVQWRAVNTYCPEVHVAVFIACCQVVQDLPVAFVLACAESYGQEALSTSLLFQVHVLLQVSDDSSDDRRTNLGTIVVNQVVCNENAQCIGKDGHRIDGPEKGGEVIDIVRGIRVVPVNTVLRS
jgi:hypothetical protein